MTNARCLTEGVDVPAIDCVMFADPKQSRIDIVQAAGRALRKYSGKKSGYIVVPLIVPEGMDFDAFAETTAFRQVAQTITALSTQDERIAEEFRLVETGRVSKGKIVEIDGDVPLGMKIKLGDFAAAISTRVWESVGRANWRQFEEARAFVHRLGFKSEADWTDYCRSNKPPDIPAGPWRVYAGTGWKGMGDWLGTGTIANRGRQYRSFQKARAHVRSLGLKTQSEWFHYRKSENRPRDIPSNPHIVYAEEGWTGIGNWLGTDAGAPHLRQYQPFKKARAYVHRLRLRSWSEWNAYCKSGKKPDDIPSNPDKTYSQAGWAGMGDWLGTGTLANQNRQYRTFKKARAFVRSLRLKSVSEWYRYCKSGSKPDDIPATPSRVYAGAGWTGIGDWLGTGTIAYFRRQYRPFRKARAFAHTLGLKSVTEWYSYCNSGGNPDDIPKTPWHVYAGEGWAGMKDWLGNGKADEQASMRALRGTGHLISSSSVASSHRREPRQSVKRVDKGWIE